MKYRKKPVIVEAVQWTGFNVGEISDFAGEHIQVRVYDVGLSVLTIHTLEGDMRADIYDFIIKGVNGEFYPCKPDIFAKTYEVAE